LSGKVIVSGDDLIYDVFFGKVEVILHDMEKPAD
jgi:predicted transcriptional regulator YheO